MMSMPTGQRAAAGSLPFGKQLPDHASLPRAKVHEELFAWEGRSSSQQPGSERRQAPPRSLGDTLGTITCCDLAC
jgi:hypothetical protein